MTAFLPPNLLALFAPREPIPYLPPVDKTLSEKKRAGYAGVGAFLSFFEDPKDVPVPVRIESKEERKERKKKERQEMLTYKLEQELARWAPADNPDAISDPYKTLFISRLNYDTSESKLRREFEQYGPISSVKMVMDKSSGKSKGYAFVEFEHERDMQAAFKHADGKRVDGRRIVVDVERGRTVKGWKPRRLGGGRGGRKTGATDPVPAGDGDRPPAGGPMRDRDRDDRGRRDRSPYVRQDRGDRGRPGGYGDRGGNGYDRGAPMRDDRRDRDRNDDRGPRFDDRRPPPRFDERGPPRNDDRFNNRNDDRVFDRNRGGRGGDRDRNNYGGERERPRR